MVLGLEPFKSEKNLTSEITVSVYETNGEFSRRVVTYDDWLNKSKALGSKKFPKDLIPKVAGALPPESSIPPKSKAYLKTQLPPGISLDGFATSSTGDKSLPDIVGDLAHWIAISTPPNILPIASQIKQSRKELRDKQKLNTPPQELQAIQRYGVCELKSLYSYLKQTMSPVAYALIRREVINRARDIITLKETPSATSNSKETLEQIITMSLKEREKSQEHTPALRSDVSFELMTAAREKLIRADKRIVDLINNMIASGL